MNIALDNSLECKNSSKQADSSFSNSLLDKSETLSKLTAWKAFEMSMKTHLPSRLIIPRREAEDNQANTQKGAIQ